MRKLDSYRHRHTLSLMIWLTLGLLFIIPAIARSQASTVAVTPTNLQGWAAANLRGAGSVAISATQPRGGGGSLEYHTTAGADKADFERFFVVAMPDPTLTLGTLDALSFDYYRASSSTVAGHLHPALRLIFYHDPGTPADPSDDSFGVLVWEEIYQVGFPGAVPLDSWDSNNVLNGRFWMFVSSGPGGSGVVQNFTSTLSDWITGAPTGLAGDPTPPNLDANTFIVGMNVGVGSGWAGAFDGFVDNVAAGFNGQTTTYNFELALPVPLTPASEPGETFLCENLEARSGGAMLAAGTTGNIRQNEIIGNTYCRIIVKNEAFVTSEAEIGIPAVLEQNLQQAVDLFGLLADGSSIVPFANPVFLCLRGNGDVLFLDAADAARTVHTLPPLAGADGEFTCINVSGSGTAILASQTGDTAVSATAPSGGVALEGCRVTMLNRVNLRSEPTTESSVIAQLPFEATYSVTESAPGWFRIIYSDTQGWVSANFARANGNCAG